MLPKDIWREPDVLVLHIKRQEKDLMILGVNHPAAIERMTLVGGRFHFSGEHFEKISTPVQVRRDPGDSGSSKPISV